MSDSSTNVSEHVYSIKQADRYRYVIECTATCKPRRFSQDAFTLDVEGAPITEQSSQGMGTLIGTKVHEFFGCNLILRSGVRRQRRIP